MTMASTQVIPTSASLVSFAAESGATVVDRFYSAERAIGRPDEKKHLGKVCRCGRNGKF